MGSTAARIRSRDASSHAGIIDAPYRGSTSLSGRHSAPVLTLLEPESDIEERGHVSALRMLARDLPALARIASQLAFSPPVKIIKEEARIIGELAELNDLQYLNGGLQQRDLPAA
jgi:hypothetical protein